MLLGAIAGDVIGSRFEFNNLKSEEFDLFEETSIPTDDSFMTLAVAEALIETIDNNQPISRALVASMRSIGRAHPDGGYGTRFSRWLFGDAEPAPYDSWGNGSAMRVSPVAWALDSLELIEFVAAETAKVTHNHPEGIKGAQATAGCIYLARHSAENADIAWYARERFGYDLDFTLDDVRNEFEFDESCQGTVPFALKVFLEADGFEQTARKAVSIGGDSDTLAAIACSVAHARYGVPKEIEKVVKDRLSDDLLELNDRFCERFGVD